MNVKCFVTVMAGSLGISIADADWFISIRRIDGKTHGPFFDFHGKEIDASRIALFIPNWKNIKWIQIKDSFLGKSESFAEDIEFKINVLSSQESNKSHQEVVEAFLELMNHT